MMTLKQHLGKNPSIKGLFLKRRKSQIQDISFHIKVLDKEWQTKSKVSEESNKY